jgi:5-formyltetrahydrofolate cyclo-ligase
MWGVLIRERKDALRAAILAQRNSLSAEDCVSRSRLIQAQVLRFPPYLRCRFVALYSPIHHEVETGEIRDHAFVTGKSVLLPRVDQAGSMELVEIASPEELEKGRFGILEPTGEKRLSDSDHGELVVAVPGIAFDLRGRRLGRGRGWYDRLIGELRVKATFIALAYEFQIVDEVPTEAWDQDVHYIVTERRVIDCRSVAAQPTQIS